VVQLACESLYALVKERFEHSGGVETSAKGVQRFEWVRPEQEEESRPEWLMEWDWQTCCTIAGAGGLEVLKHVRGQGCEWNNNTCTGAAGGGHWRF